MKLSKKLRKITNLASPKIASMGLFSSFIMIICVFGAINAMWFGWANLDYYSARNSMEQWQSTGKIGSNEDFLAAKATIQSASYLHSSHPLYKDTEGQIIEWGVFAGLSAKSSLEQATSIYQESLELRPTWPVTWANLAMIKWRKAELDSTLLFYMKMANKFGPVKPEVNSLFAEIGLRLHQQNHPLFNDISSLVKHRIVQGLQVQQNRAQIIAAIKRTDQQKTVCNWINTLNKADAKKHLNCIS